MGASSHESMSFREGVDRMVDRAALAIGLNPNTAKIIQACNAVIQIKFPVCIKGVVEIFTVITSYSIHYTKLYDL